MSHRLEELSLLQDLLRRPNKSDLKERIIRDVPRYADGMFRYAALLLEELNEPSAVDVAKTLDYPPSGLDGMYESILLRLESADGVGTQHRNREARKTLLRWLAMAIRPLTVNELAYAYAAQNEGEEFNLADKTLINKEYILKICGPLIEIVKDTVQFTHLSAKEFFFQKSNSMRPVQNEYLFDKTKTEVAMTITCSKYIAHFNCYYSVLYFPILLGIICQNFFKRDNVFYDYNFNCWVNFSNCYCALSSLDVKKQIGWKCRSGDFRSKELFCCQLVTSRKKCRRSCPACWRYGLRAVGLLREIPIG